jgi:hypothetical protein
MTDLTSWLRAWQLAKDAEDAAKDARLTAELQIVALLEKAENFKGTVKLDGVTVTYGETVKVDGEQLAEIVKHQDYSRETIAELFRSKFELNAKAWKDAGPEIKRALSPALEIKPSKPAFSRTEKKESK